MKISNSKKELARIISENGGWGGGNHAIQDKDDKCVWFMTKMKGRPSGKAFWPGCKSDRIKLDKLLPNWHQTVLSRAEYFHLYPAPGADGWIECTTGECPVSGDPVVDVKFSDGETAFGRSNEWIWSIDDGNGDIVAYRLHKPDPANSELCDSVKRSIPDPDEQVWTSPPSIEQLAADYRNAKDCAERKQQEADDAKADAEDKLKALELAGEELGLLVSPINAKQEPELVITDWRQWRVGDVVSWSLLNHVGEFEIISVHHDPSRNIGDFKVEDKHGGVYRVYGNECRFIRRP